MIPAIEQYSQSCQNIGSTCIISTMVYRIFIWKRLCCTFVMHMCSCIQGLQPAFVYVHVSCCTTDISAPKSDTTHPAQIAHVGNAILASSVGVDTVDSIFQSWWLPKKLNLHEAA